MTVGIELTPTNVNYLTPYLQFNQLTYNTLPCTLAASGVSATTTPVTQLDGSGRAYLKGAVTISAGSPTSNFPLLNLPVTLTPQHDFHFPVVVNRAGAYVDNAVKLSGGGATIASINVLTPGSGTTIPTVTTSGPGDGASLSAVMKAVSVAVATAQSGGGSYAAGDHITSTGGTSTTATVLNVTNTKLMSTAVNAAGTGYAPGNTITSAGGTFSTAVVLNVTDTKVVSATVAAGGSGGTPGTQTVTGTTGTGTKFQASVTVSGGGAITAVLSITVAGDYTVNPTLLTAEPVTGASLTGATLNIVMGVLTTTIANAGVYTVNAASFTQASTTGSGTGATFNTNVWGVNAATVLTPGSYTVLPSNPVSQGSTTGSGTGFTATMAWGVLSVTVNNGGTDFTPASAIVFSTGGATASINLGASSTGELTLMTQPNQNDIVYLDSVIFFVNSYYATTV